jgi:hypothetical protein
LEYANKGKVFNHRIKLKGGNMTDKKEGKKEKVDVAKKPQSIEAQAWNATKLDNDPEWDQIPNLAFKEDLRFAVSRVRATGTAQTNFEVKAKELIQAELEAKKDEGPMAVSAPNSALSFGAAAGAMAQAKGPHGEEPSKQDVAKAKKELEGHKETLKKTDKSGHVPTKEEAEAAAKEQKKAPIHP